MKWYIHAHQKNASTFTRSRSQPSSAMAVFRPHSFTVSPFFALPNNVSFPTTTGTVNRSLSADCRACHRRTIRVPRRWTIPTPGSSVFLYSQVVVASFSRRCVMRSVVCCPLLLKSCNVSSIAVQMRSENSRVTYYNHAVVFLCLGFALHTGLSVRRHAGR